MDIVDIMAAITIMVIVDAHTTVVVTVPIDDTLTYTIHADIPDITGNPGGNT